MARFDRGWPLAGAWAAVISILVLGAASLATGQPFWMPLNATSHGLYGPEAAQFTGFDLAHTVVGAVIHVASCFFWAAVAVLMLRGVQRGNMALAAGRGASDGGTGRGGRLRADARPVDARLGTGPAARRGHGGACFSGCGAGAAQRQPRPQTPRAGNRSNRRRPTRHRPQGLTQAGLFRPPAPAASFWSKYPCTGDADTLAAV